MSHEPSGIFRPLRREPAPGPIKRGDPGWRNTEHRRRTRQPKIQKRPASDQSSVARGIHLPEVAPYGLAGPAGDELHNFAPVHAVILGPTMLVPSAGSIVLGPPAIGTAFQCNMSWSQECGSMIHCRADEFQSHRPISHLPER